MLLQTDPFHSYGFLAFNILCCLNIIVELFEGKIWNCICYQNKHIWKILLYSSEIQDLWLHANILLGGCISGSPCIICGTLIICTGMFIILQYRLNFFYVWISSTFSIMCNCTLCADRSPNTSNCRVANTLSASLYKNQNQIKHSKLIHKAVLVF